MTDDMFDLGDPADDSEDDDEGAEDAETAPDPERTPAFDTDYRSNQHTVAALDGTWREVTDLLEDARAYSRLAGYSDVSRLEAYEAMFRLVAEAHDAEEIAERIQATRHEAADEE